MFLFIWLAFLFLFSPRHCHLLDFFFSFLIYPIWIVLFLSLYYFTHEWVLFIYFTYIFLFCFSIFMMFTSLGHSPISSAVLSKIWYFLFFNILNCYFYIAIHLDNMHNVGVDCESCCVETTAVSFSVVWLLGGAWVIWLQPQGRRNILTVHSSVQMRNSRQGIFLDKSHCHCPHANTMRSDSPPLWAGQNSSSVRDGRQCW